MLKGLVRFVGGIARLALLIVCGLILFHVLFPPWYEFRPARPFGGERWYNPYQDFAGPTLRANFHAHSYAWRGFTSGTETPENLVKLYLALGYDVPAISNYHQILPRESLESVLREVETEGFGRMIGELPQYLRNKVTHPERNLRKERPVHVPCYEHGYGLTQQHQTVLGAASVDWFEYPLFQLAANKQHVLDRLKRGAPLVVLNHATKGVGYSPADFRRLGGYDALEIASKNITAKDGTRFWDEALSAGHAVFGVAADDGHRQYKIKHSAMGWVEIDGRERTTPAVLDALRAGRFYSVWAERATPGTEVESVRIEEGRLRVKLTNDADELRAIGQDGEVRQVSRNQPGIEYVIRADDPYLRVEVDSAGTTIFLNPLFRFSGGDVENAVPEENAALTWVRRVIGAALFLLSAYRIFPRGGGSGASDRAGRAPG